MGQKVAVIDYGMGNLHSVASALEHAGAAEVVVSHDSSSILSADRLVFPGVGGIRDCMAAIRHLKCDKLLRHAMYTDRKPILAICVGMQAMMNHSEENRGIQCLGWIDGNVSEFAKNHYDASGRRLKIPHMGWNKVLQTIDHPLWAGVNNYAHFYFLHSYYVTLVDPNLSAGTFKYGVSGCAAIAQDNLFATQFHPEKSHESGIRLLRNFLRWDGTC